MISKLELFVADEHKDREPALKVGTATALVAGILSIITFVLPNALTERQTSIILVVSAFLLPIITAVITRGKVWSPASVEDVIEEATKSAEETMVGINKKSPPLSGTPKKEDKKDFTDPIN